MWCGCGFVDLHNYMCNRLWENDRLLPSSIYAFPWQHHNLVDDGKTELIGIHWAYYSTIIGLSPGVAAVWSMVPAWLLTNRLVLDKFCYESVSFSSLKISHALNFTLQVHPPLYDTVTCVKQESVGEAVYRSCVAKLYIHYLTAEGLATLSKHFALLLQRPVLCSKMMKQPLSGTTQ